MGERKLKSTRNDRSEFPETFLATCVWAYFLPGDSKKGFKGQ
jgi:hypothetical protein